MKHNWKYFLPIYIITSLIILAPIIIGTVYWERLPDNVAVHFSLTGEPDGFCSKIMAVYIMPLFDFIGQLIIIIGFIFYNKKNIPLIFEIISYWIFPICSIIAGIGIYKDFMNIKADIVFITLIFVSVLYMICGNYIPKIHKENKTDSDLLFNKILGIAFFFSGIIIFILLYTDIKELIIFILFIPLVTAVFLFIYKLIKSQKK